MDTATVASREINEILCAIQALDAKIDHFHSKPQFPHISPSTIATALLLTGITSRSRIAELLNVDRVTLNRSNDFAAFRLAEGAIRSRGSVSRRGKSGTDYVDADD